MRAALLLQESLRKSLTFIHAYRWKALWVAVTALMCGGRLSLTELGRASAGPAYGKHRVKRICRLLGNRHLHGEILKIYRAAAAYVLADVKRPIVVVDWTPIGNKLTHHALVASAPIGGRAVRLYEEVHPEKDAGTGRVEGRFLKQLKQVLPEGCRPIVVTDAGFRAPWFKAVESLGWDFVGRLRGRIKVQPAPRGAWVQMHALYAKATKKPKDLGIINLNQSNPKARRLVIVKAKKGPKRSKKVTRKTKPRGHKGRPHRSEIYRLGARDPWLLVTSLNEAEATHVVRTYSLRMQIEETFRDLKSHRFGWSFDASRCSDPRRIEVLLLIAALAAIAITLLGIAAETLDIGRRLQANTVRKRRVFSTFFLGNLLVRRDTDTVITLKDLATARFNIGKVIHEAADLLAA